jgi:pyruvate/2-oxoglutarate dehydrogenase complex dihydrolipoamide dehydrogenase (E3) component
MGEKYGVDFRFGTQADAEEVLAEKPDVVILATGGEPSIPDIPGIDNHQVATANDVLLGKIDVGKKVLIIGGGLVGSETADFLGEHGHEVTLVEALPEIAEDVQESVKHFLLLRLKRHEVRIETNTKVKEILQNGVKVEKDGQESQLTGYNNIIIAVGAKPVNDLKPQLEGKVPELHVIGDASEPRKAIDAIEEGASLAIKI